MGNETSSEQISNIVQWKGAFQRSELYNFLAYERNSTHELGTIQGE